MKTFILVFLTTWLFFALNTARAQSPEGKISGVVVDKNNKPVDGATLVLINVKDSATVKTLLGNADGSFLFDGLANGQYQVRVSLLGYANYKSAVISMGDKQSLKLATIVLTQTSKALKQVEVSGQKNLIEHKIDRTVVNVNASITNTGANALEVLEKTPGVIVDEDGNITFKGKSGVMVMIDDKPSYLSGEDLANYLKAMPASQLDVIELMSNPPAKYDAAGNAGVINIKTKKNRAQGFNGSFAASVGDAAYWRTLESLNLNYHVNNINLFATLGYGFIHNYRRLDVTRTYLDPVTGAETSEYFETAFFHPNNYNPNAKFGMDYYLSPKTTIGFVLTGTFSTGNNSTPVNSAMVDNTGKTDSTILANNNTQSKFYNKGINLNYNHQFAQKGQEISFDLDYLNYNSNKDQQFFNTTYNGAGILGSSQNIIDNLPADINIYTAKTDYAQPLGNKAKIEMGLKTSYVNTDNAANYFNVVNNITTVNNDNTNRFLYKENINAAYVSFNQEFKRFEVKAGLRLENTNVKGHQLGNAVSPDSSFVQHYTDLFPTAYLVYKLDTAGHHTLNLTYGRRIDRPYYQDLNPFVTIIDKYSQFSGNPFLRPQFSSDYELAYSYKSLFTISTEYNPITDYQVEVDNVLPGGIFGSTTGNLGRRDHWGVTANLALNPTKWWNFNFYNEVMHNQYHGQITNLTLNSSNTYYYFNWTNQFNLGHGWNAEMTTFYVSPSKDSQFTHRFREQTNLGISKKVLNNKGSIKLSGRDVFRQNFSAGNITNIPNVLATYHNDNANRVVTLGFTYNFGTTPKDQKKRDTNSAEDEQRRVGN